MAGREQKLLDQTIPIINTQSMSKLIARFVNLFPQTSHTTALWICARIEKFGFRPSLERDYLPNILREWVAQLEKWKVVVTPLVFYRCKDTDIEVEDKAVSQADFFVTNHYNLLISWINNEGKIVLERYEPAKSTYQGALDQKLQQLLTNTFQKYTSRAIEYNLIAESGLQNKLKDKTLCGYHILYWMLYRLKHGRDKALQMLASTPETILPIFNNFCQCMSSLSDQKGCLAKV